MQRILSLAMALCLSLTLSVDAFAAKRFGGGKSFGSAPTHQTQQRQTQQAAPAPTAPSAGAMAGAAAKPSGASRWLGPLAGIAAGGLLASMFMGDGFEGFQFLDFLILGLIAFLAFRFFARRKMQAQTPAYAGMGNAQAYQAPQQPAYSPAANTVFGGAAQPARTFQAPAWFDEQRFLAAAREHFLSLQQHWDGNEMDKIAEFVTPQLLEFLKQERASLGDGFQSTYIDQLQVRLDGIEQQGGKTLATLTFDAVAKSSRFDQGEAFSESWAMERLDGDNQPWLLAGIRQNG
ncbi:Tim44 domain-containing protein [Pseudomonas oryzae]|uniref:Predicted lipid-binding transport protein, Tim44 family n=1 Tax=Pseudomonas oryzae TaxID=1392877 RepID=A0A1H1XYX7_9PSED|nr:TIM44-like domain-containing protein [Pseudomonas oryzae]SDT14305.1 Predicted lipid-binding transport protein, Tim44 family [Pseudomonas oryzae]